jgi:hypothetical protein
MSERMITLHVQIKEVYTVTKVVEVTPDEYELLKKGEYTQEVYDMALDKYIDLECVYEYTVPLTSDGVRDISHKRLYVFNPDEDKGVYYDAPVEADDE